jgi:hypothetical protein
MKKVIDLVEEWFLICDFEEGGHENIRLRLSAGTHSGGKATSAFINLCLKWRRQALP